MNPIDGDPNGYDFQSEDGRLYLERMLEAWDAYEDTLDPDWHAARLLTQAEVDSMKMNPGFKAGDEVEDWPFPPKPPFDADDEDKELNVPESP